MFGQPKNQEPVQQPAEEKQEVKEAPSLDAVRKKSIESGQKLADSLELLKSSLPKYRWLGPERTSMLSQLMTQIQRMIAGQHADMDVSELDIVTESVVNQSLPFLLEKESQYDKCLESLRGLIEAAKARVGDENAVKAAKVRTQIISLEVEQTKLTMDLSTLEEKAQRNNLTIRELSKKIIEGDQTPSVKNELNSATSNDEQIATTKKDIEEKLREVNKQLNMLNQQNVLIDIAKGTVSEEVYKSIISSLEDYRQGLLDLHTHTLELTEAVESQSVKIDATVKVIRDEQKLMEQSVVLTEEASKRLQEVNQQPVTNNNTQTQTQTQTQTAQQHQVMYEEN